MRELQIRQRNRRRGAQTQMAWLGKLGAGVLGILCWIGCATPSSRERMAQEAARARPHPGALIAEGFFLDERSPEDREVEEHRFYFKDCELVSRRRFPSRAEYECQAK